jgi:hypothetical protein
MFWTVRLDSLKQDSMYIYDPTIEIKVNEAVKEDEKRLTFVAKNQFNVIGNDRTICNQDNKELIQLTGKLTSLGGMKFYASYHVYYFDDENHHPAMRIMQLFYKSITNLKVSSSESQSWEQIEVIQDVIKNKLGF